MDFVLSLPKKLHQDKEAFAFSSTFKIFLLEEGGTCFPSLWIGDGFCDDHLNNVKCGFDGDDCCLPEASHEHCEVCACIVKDGIQTFTTVFPPSDFEIDIPDLWILTEPNWIFPG